MRSSATGSVTAFNDVAVVRFPGQRTARRGRAWPAATRSSATPPTRSSSPRRPAPPPTASRPAARSSARRSRPCWSRPASPHSAYNRGLVLSLHDSLALEILPDSGDARRGGRRPAGRARSAPATGSRCGRVPAPRTWSGSGARRSTSGPGASSGWPTRPRSPLTEAGHVTGMADRRMGRSAEPGRAGAVRRLGEPDAVELLADPDRPRAWTLLVGSTPQSYVDLDDPALSRLRVRPRLGHVIDLAAPAKARRCGCCTSAAAR